MKLLLDQGLPRSSTVLLRELGYDAVHVGEIGAANHSDLEILERAAKENRIVVTLDADFHTLLATHKAKGPSVIRIRTEGVKPQKLIEILQEVLTRCNAELIKGAALSVRKNQVRVKLLPFMK